MDSDQLTIREAVPQDIPQLCVLLDALRQETVWGTLPFQSDYDHAARLFVDRIAKNEHYVVVVETPALLVGFCGGSVETHPFIPDFPYLMEWAIYVVPEYRSRTVGRAMWQAMQVWGLSHGALGAVYGRPKKGILNGIVEEVHWHYWGTHDRVAV